MRLAWHAAKARQLVSAVGGVKEAAHILGYETPDMIYRIQRGEYEFRPSQIVALESAAMVPIYSGDMAGLVGKDDATGCPVEQATTANVHAARMASAFVRALADGHLNAAEKKELRPIIAALRERLDACERHVEGAPSSILAAE